jgi:hypothetical protein
MIAGRNELRLAYLVGFVVMDVEKLSQERGMPRPSKLHHQIRIEHMLSDRIRLPTTSAEIRQQRL